MAPNAVAFVVAAFNIRQQTLLHDTDFMTELIVCLPLKKGMVSVDMAFGGQLALHPLRPLV